VDAERLRGGVVVSAEALAMRFGCTKLLYCIYLQISIGFFLGLIGLNDRFGAGLSKQTHRLCLGGHSFPVFKFLRVNNAHPY
jgi:hypothetical protein